MVFEAKFRSDLPSKLLAISRGMAPVQQVVR